MLFMSSHLVAAAVSHILVWRGGTDGELAGWTRNVNPEVLGFEDQLRNIRRFLEKWENFTRNNYFLPKRREIFYEGNFATFLENSDSREKRPRCSF